MAEYSRDKIASILQEIAAKNNGYLTTVIYDKLRGSYPSSRWITSQFSSFEHALKYSNVKTKSEYEKDQNYIKIIKNFKYVGLKNNGVVTQSLYEEEKLSPGVKYISKHFGWQEMIEKAGVHPHSQLQSTEQLIAQFRETIKDLGYIPTRDEYETLGLNPKPDTLNSRGLNWAEALKKAGYQSYGKSVAVKDKVCANLNCYTQFTPFNSDQEYCSDCYKKFRIEASKKLDSLHNIAKIKEITRLLLFNGNEEKIIREIIDKF